MNIHRKYLIIFTIIIFILIASIVYSEESRSSNKPSLLNFLFPMYQDVKVYFDLGLIYRLELVENQDYEVYNKSTGQFEKRISKETSQLYSANNKGVGFGFQYSIGFGIFKFLNWKERPFMGLGLFSDVKCIYSRDSSIFSAIAGIDMRAFWIINYQIGYGYTKFTNRLPYIDHFEIESENAKQKNIFTEKYINGPELFFALGVNIPYSDNYAIYSHIQAVYFDIKSDEPLGAWWRMSIVFGIIYKL